MSTNAEAGQSRMQSPSEEEEESVTAADFNVNYRDFLNTPIHYANLPHVTYDGSAFHLTFMTWSLAPGAVFPAPDGGRNPLSVSARIAMPKETAQMLMQLLANAGVSLPKQQEDGNTDDANS
jgi:hypothetical protein